MKHIAIAAVLGLAATTATLASEKAGEPCAGKGVSISQIDKDVFLCADGKWSAHSTVGTEKLDIDVVLTQDGKELLRTQAVTLTGAPSTVSMTPVPGTQVNWVVIMIPKVKPNGQIEILVHAQANRDAITKSVELVGGKEVALRFGEKSEFGLQLKATCG